MKGGDRGTRQPAGALDSNTQQDTHDSAKSAGRRLCHASNLLQVFSLPVGTVAQSQAWR